METLTLMERVHDTDRYCHFWKIRKDGFRDYYMSKGWRPVGYGAAKRVGGHERLMFTKSEGEDYILCGFCIRRKRPTVLKLPYVTERG